jgi:mannose-6-phosphate isomerase
MDLLTSSVQAYSWGSATALPTLLGRPPTGQPQAELWVGAHERLPSRLSREGVERTLDDVIADDPQGELGEALAATARLPFLLKILAVERPLSLQLHPDGHDAARGFAAEEESGVERDAAQRSFPDPWPKPEMLYAIGDFCAFCGFAEVEEARRTVQALDAPQLQPVSRALRVVSDPLRAALAAALRLSAADVRAVTERVAAAALRAGDDEKGRRTRTLASVAREFPEDPAVIALLLMRAVTLAPGEACFVGPGQLHCYVSGMACEVQGNSDNVLRAGLTAKHVDVERVVALAETRAGGSLPVPVRADGMERVYEPPVKEFALAEITDVDPPEQLSDVAGPALLMCLRGRYELVADDGQHLSLRQGQAAFVPAKNGSLSVRGSGVLLRLTGSRGG